MACWFTFSCRLGLAVRFGWFGREVSVNSVDIAVDIRSGVVLLDCLLLFSLLSDIYVLWLIAYGFGGLVLGW